MLFTKIEKMITYFLIFFQFIVYQKGVDMERLTDSKWTVQRDLGN